MNLLEIIREELNKAGHRCTEIVPYTDASTFNLQTGHTPATTVCMIALHHETLLHINVWWPHCQSINDADIDLTEPDSVPRLIKHLEPLRLWTSSK